MEIPEFTSDLANYLLTSATVSGFLLHIVLYMLFDKDVRAKLTSLSACFSLQEMYVFCKAAFVRAPPPLHWQ